MIRTSCIADCRAQLLALVLALCLHGGATSTIFAGGIDGLEVDVKIVGDSVRPGDIGILAVTAKNLTDAEMRISGFGGPIIGFNEHAKDKWRLKRPRLNDVQLCGCPGFVTLEPNQPMSLAIAFRCPNVTAGSRANVDAVDSLQAKHTTVSVAVSFELRPLFSWWACKPQIVSRRISTVIEARVLNDPVFQQPADDSVDQLIAKLDSKASAWDLLMLLGGVQDNDKPSATANPQSNVQRFLMCRHDLWSLVKNETTTSTDVSAVLAQMNSDERNWFIPKFLSEVEKADPTLHNSVKRLFVQQTK